MVRNSKITENGQSIGRGFAVLSFSSIAVKLLSLIFVPVMRKLLGGSYGYGVFAAANEVYAFVYVITSAGMPVAVSKIVSELTSYKNPREAERSFRLARSMLILLGLIFSVLMAVFAKPVAHFMNNDESWAGLLFLSPSILICSVMAAYRGYFQGRRNMTPTAVSQIVEQLVHVVISIITVLLLKNRGIIWAVAGASIGTTIGSFVSLLIIINYKASYKEIEKKERRIGRIVPTKSLIFTLIYYSIPITLSSGIQYGGNMIDASILSGRLTAAGFSEKTSIALYGDLMATRQLINVPTALVSALCVSILPALTALFAKNDMIGTKEKAEYGFKLLYTVAMPIAVAMTVFAREIYKLLGFGSNYVLLTTLSFSVLLLGTVHLQNSIMQSVNKLFTSTVFLGISILIKALLNYILVSIHSLNVYGAVLSTYISYVIPLLLNHYFLVRKTGLNVNPVKKAVLPFICSLIMIAVAYPIEYLLGLPFGDNSYIGTFISFVPAATAGALVYFVLLSKTGGITEEDISSISPGLLKVMNELNLNRLLFK